MKATSRKLSRSRAKAARTTTGRYFFASIQFKGRSGLRLLGAQKDSESRTAKVLAMEARTKKPVNITGLKSTMAVSQGQ